MKLSENIDFKTSKKDQKSYVKYVRFCEFWKFSKQWFTRDLIERAKNTSHYRSTDVDIFFGMIIQKILIKITDVFWFLETFSPLISFASFAAGRYILRYGHPKGDPGLRFGFRSPSLITLSTFVAKSLFKTRKISDLQGFFGDHPKKNVNSVISILRYIV